jgi:hypothetical protein
MKNPMHDYLLPYQKIAVESLSLKRKELADLDTFIVKSPVFQSLDLEDQNLLKRQSMFLSNVVDILQQRIARF